MASKKQKEERCDPETVSVANCPSLKRMIQALHFFNAMKDDISNDKNLLIDYLEKECPKLLDDYGHIIHEHLCAKKEKKDREAEFEAPHNKVSKLVTCKLSNCSNYLRNSRDRKNEEIKEQEGHLTVDIMDTIHVLFCHSYDCGYRLPTENSYNDCDIDDSIINDDDDKDDDNDDNAETTFVDARFNDITKRLTNIRGEVGKIRGFERAEHSKFVGEVTGVPTTTDDGNNNQKEEKEAPKDADSIMYSFGQRCYYWPFYKNNKDIDRHYHGNETYGTWYVPNKFKDIKEEITQNPVSTLSLTAYDSVVTKTNKFLKNAQIKDMQGYGDNPNANTWNCDIMLQYEQESYSQRVQPRHLMSLIFYTDFSDFCYFFSKSFRKLNLKETDQEFRKRKSNFYWISKALRELIELYGQEIHNDDRGYKACNKIRQFYTGISAEIVFPSFSCRLNGPTSTSAQVTVATMFAKDNGILVIMEMNYLAGHHLRFFNCSLVSTYANEDERLFIGGRQFITIANIIRMKNGGNLRLLVEAINKFDKVLTGTLNFGTTVSKKEGKIMKRFIDHYLETKNNRFCGFVNTLFKAIVESKKIAKIDSMTLRRDARYYAPFMQNDKRIPAFCEMIKYMPNLECFSLEKEMFKKPIAVDALLMDACVDVLKTKPKMLSEINVLNACKIAGHTDPKEVIDQKSSEWIEFVAKCEKLKFKVFIEKRMMGFGNRLTDRDTLVIRKV